MPDGEGDFRYAFTPFSGRILWGDVLLHVLFWPHSAPDMREHIPSSIVALLEPFRDHFFRPQYFAAPGEAAFYSHHNPTVVLRELSRLETHYFVHR